MPVTTARAASPGSPTNCISGSNTRDIHPITGVCSRILTTANTGIRTVSKVAYVFRPSVNPLIQVSLVINYDLPRNKECYIHRIGRCGRYGRKGCAINFVNDDEENALVEIEKFYSTSINVLPSDLSVITK